MVKDLLKPVKIPSVWRYSESWCDRKIESVYDLNKLCKNRDAEFDIQYFLYSDAQSCYNNIKMMNVWIQRLSIEEIDNMPPDDIDSLIDKLPGDSGDSNLKRPHWISEYEIKMDVANYTKAPDFVVAAVDDALSICRAGRQKYIDLVAYLREVEKGHRAALLSAAQERSYDDYSNKWGAFEARHVQVTSGFIYLLSHELMPGIHKIGFTSRNPDTRAAELSQVHKLPSSFTVTKYWRTADPYIVEQRIHKELDAHRKPGEFFEGDCEHFFAVIEKYVMKPE